jgi:sulfate adenylyltransferase subunit 1 (EFTu-like GTPase family)
LTDNEALSADYRAKGNIGLRRGGSEWGIDELGRDSLVYTLQVTPNSEGRAAVQVMATIQIAGTLQNRVVTIPVQTGEAGAKPVARYSGKVATTAAGQAVVSLPAETAITAAVEQK